MTTTDIPNSFSRSPMAQAIAALYRAGSSLADYVNAHIEELKASGDESISSVGRVLDQARRGLLFGYAAPVVIIAMGQLLLGNPLAGVVSGAAMLFSPVSMTCAAVGAIYMGWNALNPKHRAKLLEMASAGLGLAVDILVKVVTFAVETAQQLLGKPQLVLLRKFVSTQAQAFGNNLAKVTGSVWDYASDLLPTKPPVPKGGDEALSKVLVAMSRPELSRILISTFGYKKVNLTGQRVPALRKMVADKIADAAAYSWPRAQRPTYPMIVAMVAKQLKLPSPADRDVREVERVILFKVIELALGKLSDEDKAKVTRNVEEQLHERGIQGRVAFEEIFRFVKTGGVDIGGTLGGLVLAGPGIYGVVGYNFLQFIVLKAIILTSGYMAAGGAMLGFGASGLMLMLAGWAGPMGIGLAVVFTVYSVAGPAFRKLVPAVCLIAAKRLEIAQVAS